jgi:hypothetical protein
MRVLATCAAAVAVVSPALLATLVIAALSCAAAFVLSFSLSSGGSGKDCTEDTRLTAFDASMAACVVRSSMSASSESDGEACDGVIKGASWSSTEGRWIGDSKEAPPHIKRLLRRIAALSWKR